MNPPEELVAHGKDYLRFFHTTFASRTSTSFPTEEEQSKLTDVCLKLLTHYKVSPEKLTSRLDKHWRKQIGPVPFSLLSEPAVTLKNLRFLDRKRKFGFIGLVEGLVERIMLIPPYPLQGLIDLVHDQKEFITHKDLNRDQYVKLSIANNQLELLKFEDSLDKSSQAKKYNFSYFDFKPGKRELGLQLESLLRFAKGEAPKISNKDIPPLSICQSILKNHCDDGSTVNTDLFAMLTRPDGTPNPSIFRMLMSIYSRNHFVWETKYNGATPLFEWLRTLEDPEIDRTVMSSVLHKLHGGDSIESVRADRVRWMNRLRQIRKRKKSHKPTGQN